MGNVLHNLIVVMAYVMLMKPAIPARLIVVHAHLIVVTVCAMVKRPVCLAQKTVPALLDTVARMFPVSWI
jgi:hypothetical protein